MTPMAPSVIPVLLYHGVAPRVAGRARRQWTVEPAVFDEHVSTLTEAGYALWTLGDVRAAIDLNRPLPALVAAVTFDDALSDVAEAAHEILVRVGARATIFVPTDHVDRGRTWLTAEHGSSARTLSWDELRALAAAGHEVGSHGRTHVPLDLLEGPALRDEVLGSRGRLEDELACEVRSFAYPFGLYGQPAMDEVRDAGYRSACAVRYRVSRPTDDAFRLPRIQVGDATSGADLLQLVAGGNRAVGEWRKRIVSYGWRSSRAGVRPLVRRAPLSRRRLERRRSLPAAAWPALVAEVDVLSPKTPRAQLGEVPARFRSIHVVVRAAGVPLGASWLTNPFQDAELDDAVRGTARPLGTGRAREVAAGELPFVSVIIPTRDHPEQLRSCVESVLRCDYPREKREIVVVDSASETPAARELAAEFSASGVRCVRLGEPGASLARNAGARAAEGDVLAFIDDDAYADRAWLRAGASVFVGRPDIACVTGLMLPSELETEAQVALAASGGWCKGFERREFRLGRSEGLYPLFPLRATMFGSGANMMFRRDFLTQRLRGFDLTFNKTAGLAGGDIEAFFRTVMEGATLVYDPSVVVRHRDRTTFDGYARQMHAYGVGFSAFLLHALLQHPSLAIGLLRDLPHAVRRGSAEVDAPVSPHMREVRRSELRGLAIGPARYVLARSPLGRGRGYDW
jgi:peptidoglycan/xylan/chitin deacetylase (PgdA/CDA1 family)/glycosyltransferase involved in cell wall biosynthesis